MASLVEFSRTGTVGGITLSSRETINRVCADQTEALLEAGETTNADTSNVCATLVARGDVFYAGADFAFDLGFVREVTTADFPRPEAFVLEPRAKRSLRLEGR